MEAAPSAVFLCAGAGEGRLGRGYEDGVNTMLRLRSYNEGTGGAGNGDDFDTAVSIERITASLPLQRTTRTSTMSPLDVSVS